MTNLTEQPLNPKPMTEEAIQDWLANQIAEQIGIDPDEVDIQASFDSYGLNSVQAMSLANLGKEYLGVKLSPLVIWNHPNIESLSQYLAQQIEAAELETFEI